VLLNSDLSLFRSNGQPVPDNLDLSVDPSDEEDDPEDQGEFSIGYRNEPWAHRAKANPDLSMIFSSHVHGDPAVGESTSAHRAHGGRYQRRARGRRYDARLRPKSIEKCGLERWNLGAEARDCR